MTVWKLSLLQLLFELLLVILQVHNRLQGEFQISLQLAFDPFQVHTQLLLLFQWALQLIHSGESETCHTVCVYVTTCGLSENNSIFCSYFVVFFLGDTLTSSTCCSSFALALVRVLTLSSSACRSSRVCWWASWRAFLSLVSFTIVSSRTDISSIRFFTCEPEKENI